MRDFDELTGPPELVQGRLRLRTLRADDKAAVVAALNDPLAGRFLWRPPFPYAGSDFDEFYSSSLTFWDDFGLSLWIVADATSDAVLACISLSIDPEREAGELGYWAAPGARGSGAVSGAVRLARDWAFDELELQRLEITTDVDNLASQHVAQAIGMRREGLLRGYLTARGTRRDHVLYAMLPGDPRVPAVPLPAPALDDGFLRLRPVQESDVPAIARACADPGIAHWIYDLPAAYQTTDAQRFVASAQQQLVQGSAAHCAVLGHGSDELLGALVLRVFPELTGMAFGEIGYWVAPWARRRGVALGATRLVIRWAYQDLGLERLEILTYPGNAASQALVEKLGFTRIGLVRGYLPAEPGKDRAGRVEPLPDGSLPPRDDQVVFSLARAEWEAEHGWGGLD